MSGPQAIRHRSRPPPGPAEQTPAFTLVELLVVTLIMATLLALVGSGLVRVRQESKSFLCMDHGRAAAVDFRIFADSYAHGYRGDSEKYGNRIDAMDFLESLYETGEFWRGEGVRVEAYRSGQKPIICPAAPQGLLRLKPDTHEYYTPYVKPLEAVSYALNRRLFRAPAVGPGGILWETPVLVGERVLNHPNVPLLFDVNAEAALRSVGGSTRWFLPFFCTPEPWGRNWWFPAWRHRGRMNLAFVGGHVLSTPDPSGSREFEWTYFPTPDGS